MCFVAVIRAVPRDDKPNAVLFGNSGSRCGSRVGISRFVAEVAILVLL